jgi:hypothetical protein
MSEPIEISEAFNDVALLIMALGEFPLHKHEGCFVYQIDGQWRMAVNGHREVKSGIDEGGAYFEVPPFSCLLWYNGWPAGCFNPTGGIIAAGEGANEQTFIEAVKAATARANAARA